MAYWLKIISCNLLLCINLPVFAQEVNTPQNPWPLRAQALTDEIVSDANQLSKFDRALMYVRLADIWWKSDQERARKWLQKAVLEVESVPESEDPAENSRRVSAARVLFSMIAIRDKKLGDRLMAIFNSNAVERGNKEDRQKNADALVELALANLEGNPQRAAELGLASLRAGASYNLTVLILRMHKIDTKLAGELFDQGLVLARAARDEELLDILASAAFPHKIFFPPAAAPVLPERMRIATLNLYAENLLTTPSSAEDATASCKFSWTAAKLLDQYLAFLPQYAGGMRQAIERCQANLNSFARQHQNDDMSDHPLRTGEDYLRAAKDASDPKMRAVYLGRGAYTSFSEGKPEQAIEMIESMSEAEREILPEGLWNNWRWWFAASAALKHYKSGDRYMMQKIIDAVPVNLRGFAMVNLIDELVTEKPPATARQLLDDARKYLAKTDTAFTQRGDFFLALARLYGVLMPADGPVVFGEAIKAVNRSEQQKQKDKTDKDSPNAVFPPWQAIKLPAALLELDDAGVGYMAASIESPLRRTQVRLGLLASSVENLRVAPPPAKRIDKPAKSH